MLTEYFIARFSEILSLWSIFFQDYYSETASLRYQNTFSLIGFEPFRGSNMISLTREYGRGLLE